MAFDHIDTWVFDLDNTLYNAEPHSFPQMGQRMTAFVADTLKLPVDQADVIRKGYYHKYGTTLRGLMLEHGIAPHEFLSFVHDFDLSPIAHCPVTQDTLKNLHGRKIVFTNAPQEFATRMLGHLGIADAFDGIFAVEDADFLPKPMAQTYDLFLKRHNVAATRACMVEDMEINLVPAHARGMTTVWLHGNGKNVTHSHVHHSAPRLPDFFAHDYFTTTLKKATR